MDIPDPSSTVPQYQKYFVQNATFYLLLQIHATMLQYKLEILILSRPVSHNHARYHELFKESFQMEERNVEQYSHITYRTRVIATREYYSFSRNFCSIFTK